MIASAFGLSVAQRRRDLALLRIVGATPRQVARMVRAEAALVGVAGSAVGCLLGVIWAPLLARWIASQGLSPAWFSVQLTAGSVPALVIAFLAGVAVAVASVLVAALRAGRIGPTEALREAAVEPTRVGPAGSSAASAAWSPASRRSPRWRCCSRRPPATPRPRR